MRNTDTIHSVAHQETGDPIYLRCHECKNLTLRYSTTIDGLRCQSCGVAYVNSRQVDAQLDSSALVDEVVKLNIKWDFKHGWRLYEHPERSQGAESR